MKLPIGTSEFYLEGKDAETTQQRLYEAWRAARDQGVRAYEVWCRAPLEERRNAYAVYLAAADQESAAEAAFLKVA